MSPDEDERMERAKRIRELREQGGGEREGTDERPGESTEESDEENVDETVTAAAAETAAGATGLELPDQEQMAAALGGTAAGESAPARDGDAEGYAASAGVAAGASARGATTTTSTTALARVLEFTLGDELYCLDIADVEEIVKRETLTRVPNTPEYVEGVVDLRGQITTILDAKCLLDVDEDGGESLVVVFAPDAFEDQGAVGWVVDEVRQVRPVTDDEMRDPPGEDDYLEGIVDRADTDELAVWVRPDAAISGAIDDGPDE